MSDLYLIGNGFDLFHGLPSDYYYFGCYLIKNYPEFYSELGRMYGFKTMIGSHFLEEFEDAVECDLFWSKFEERLGLLDPLWLEESLIDDLDLEYPDDAVDIEIPEVTNADTIKKYFNEWVVNTLNTNVGLKIVASELGKKKLDLSENSFFVNFNYTSILEKIYGIPDKRIFHIHGISDLEEAAELIVGHGNKNAITGYQKRIESIEAETYYLSSQAERNRLNEYCAEKEILENLLKDTDSLVADLKCFLRNKKIDSIYIMGLSCGNVDLPYIECIKELYPKAVWHFSYFNDKEKEARKKLVDKLLMKVDGIEYFLFKNENANEIKEKIIDKLSIQVYKKI